MTSRGILGGVALTLLASFGAAMPAAALTPHSPVFIDERQPVVVQAGDEFFIALPSNRTTGYMWMQTIGDEKTVAYEGNVYQPPSGGLAGQGGQQIFIYHANRSGTTAIRFSYARPFEPGQAPAKSAVFSVTVQ